MAVVFRGPLGMVTLLVILIAAMNWFLVLLAAVANLHYPSLIDATSSSNFITRTPFTPVHPVSKDLLYLFLLAFSNSLRQHNYRSTLDLITRAHRRHTRARSITSSG